MDSISDFEDMLALFHKREVRYLIIGGLAFIYHAKPRYTKDMDLWVEFEPENVDRANRALDEFGSPSMLSTEDPGEVLQLGFAPDRIDFFMRIEGVDFETAWSNRVIGEYGSVSANWIGLDDLLAIKSKIDKSKHREDARILAEVKRLKNQ